MDLSTAAKYLSKEILSVGLHGIVKFKLAIERVKVWNTNNPELISNMVVPAFKPVFAANR